MTVVVAFVGSDGAVMAADTEATEGGHSRFDVDKIWKAGGLTLGYTGNDAVKQPLAAQIDANIANHFGDAPEVDRWQARSALQAAIGPVLKHSYSHYVGPMHEGVPAGLHGAVLVVGRDANGYWLLEVDKTNSPTFYEEHGFHGVGSGSPAAYMAHSLMRDYAPIGRSVAHLKLIAFRTVQTCIDTVGGVAGVGGDVRLWYSQNDGPFAKAEPDEMAAIGNGVNDWRGVERESLDKVIPAEQVAPPAEAVELPGRLNEDEDAEGEASS